MKIIDLDLVWIRPEVHAEWQKIALEAAKRYAVLPARMRTSIPTEQGRINEETGVMTIFVDMPVIGEVTLDVPAGHWGYMPQSASLN
jgi:hypothetical protein